MFIAWKIYYASNCPVDTPDATIVSPIAVFSLELDIVWGIKLHPGRTKMQSTASHRIHYFKSLSGSYHFATVTKCITALITGRIESRLLYTFLYAEHYHYV